MAPNHCWNIAAISGIATIALLGASPSTALAQPCATSGWTQTLPFAGVPARATTAVAEASGGTAVMFGGTGSGTVYNDTWVFNGTAWQQRAVAGPSARSGHTMAYDAARQRTVLFGGQSFGLDAETWEWDGSGWQQISPAISPPAILDASLGYDGVNGRVILVGGRLEATGEPNLDFWAYDGTTWTNIGQDGPSLRTNAAMTYDSARQRLVLFGGISTQTFGTLQDTWEFDGANWAPTIFGSEGFGIASASLAFDSVRERVVLSGGFDLPTSTFEYDGTQWIEASTTTPGNGLPVVYSGAANRVVQLQAEPSLTWSWDGATWSSVDLASIPALNGHSMVYNATNSRAMIFGGTTFLGRAAGELWSFEGTRWSLVSADGPSPRDRVGLVNDTQRGGLVLFGGFDPQNGASGETWTWNGSWSQLDISGPTARSGHAMAYDVSRNQTVVFGGFDSEFTRIGDTWVLQGSTWSQVTGATGPAARDRASMAYDPNRGRVVLFGGRDENFEIGNDTWEFNGTTWVPVVSAGRPPARYAATLSYDAAVGKLVLVGGLNANFETLDDTWVLDQANGWQRIVTPTNSIGPRSDHAAAYVPSLSRTLVQGGFTGDSTVGDSWQFAAGIVANVTQQPQGGVATSGQNFTFSTLATADRAVSYAWTRDGSPLSDGATATGSIISGANTQTLTLTNSQPGDTASYACVISTECGFTITNDARLSVCQTASPVFSQQPTSQSACPTSFATFDVAASGDGVNGLLFQWQLSYLSDPTPIWFDLFDGGVFSNTGDFIAIAAGTFAPSVSFSAPEGGFPITGPLFRLRCVVTSDCGATNSDTVIFTSLPASDPTCGGTVCDPDVNQDGNADQGDVDYIINVIAGGDNPTNIDPDFNLDGNADQGDIDALVNVIAGGACP